MTEFFDRQDETNPWNGAKASDARGLLRLLEAQSGRQPFFAEVIGSNGFKLLVGLGASSGCVQYSPSNGDRPYTMAVAEQTGEAQAESFLIGGEQTPMQSRFCMPMEKVRQVASYFAETGERSPAVEWEEI